MTVIKLVTEGTVDEDIYDLGERKRLLSAAVLDKNVSNHNDVAEEDDVVRSHVQMLCAIAVNANLSM